MKKLITIGMLASFGAAAQAVTLVLAVDLGGAGSYAGYGNALNFMQTVNLDTYFGFDYSGYTLTGIGYEDAEWTTENGSYLEEIIFSVETSDGSAYFDNQLFPGQGAPGVATIDSAGGFGLPLAGTGVGGGSTAFTVLPDDTVNVLLYETFNDAGAARDGVFSAGSKAYVRFEAVPEPATMAALGLGVAALLRRRKK
ncbi:MAG: PEP-CTERM sorting domain-containing protein [Chthonomonas sp.]|nr:PEP-CTERM sorting domain-containing protein [Chthonomonas sp.]